MKNQKFPKQLAQNKNQKRNCILNSVFCILFLENRYGTRQCRQKQDVNVGWRSRG